LKGEGFNLSPLRKEVLFPISSPFGGNETCKNIEKNPGGEDGDFKGILYKLRPLKGRNISYDPRRK